MRKYIYLIGLLSTLVVSTGLYAQGKQELKWFHWAQMENVLPHSILLSKEEIPSLTLTNDHLLVAERYDGWNSFEMDWIFKDSLEYSYDENEQLTVTNFRDYTSNTWPYTRRIENSYNNLGQPDTSLEFSRINNSWQIDTLDQRVLWEYDSENRLTVEEIQAWDGTEWKGNTQYLSTYENINSHVSSYTTKNWMDETWININRRLYESYDVSGNLLSEIQEWWESESWQPQFRITRTYNNDNNLLTYGVETYIDENWQTAYRRTFSYDNNGHQTGWLQESWSEENQSWSPFYQEQYIVNADGLRTLLFSQSWAPQSESWRNLITVDYTYNNNDQLAIEHAQRWNSSQEVWENLDRRFYYYGNGINANHHIQYSKGWQIFPVPTSGQIFLKRTSSQKGLINPIEVRIFSLQGQLLKVFSLSNGGNSQIFLDLSNFPPSHYVFQLIEGSRSSIQIIVIAR
ncbi:MAG: hypothetical protein DHS20C13_29020 [Thermodesulfobacteriota bacterium]|nr:MAG: hypothetical protein DHS20C13_29020 [Thermodesulfobacteriota bacterium]